MTTNAFLPIAQLLANQLFAHTERVSALIGEASPAKKAWLEQNTDNDLTEEDVLPQLTELEDLAYVAISDDVAHVIWLRNLLKAMLTTCEENLNTLYMRTKHVNASSEEVSNLETAEESLKAQLKGFMVMWESGSTGLSKSDLEDLGLKFAPNKRGDGSHFVVPSLPRKRETATRNTSAVRANSKKMKVVVDHKVMDGTPAEVVIRHGFQSWKEFCDKISENRENWRNPSTWSDAMLTHKNFTIGLTLVD